MTIQEMIKTLEDKKNSMFTAINSQSSQLKPGYTRESAKKVFSQLESIKNATMNRYAYHSTIAEYLIEYLEKRGYNQYSLETRFKHVKLYKSRNEWIMIKDKVGKEFLMVYFDLMGIKPIEEGK